MKLNRAKILKCTNLKTETVNVPEWGGDVTVRELDGKGRDAWEMGVITQNKKGDAKFNGVNARAKLIIRSVIDDDGNLIFTDDDIDAIGCLSASALGKVFDVASKLSGLTSEDMAELEEN